MKGKRSSQKKKQSKPSSSTSSKEKREVSSPLPATTCLPNTKLIVAILIGFVAVLVAATTTTTGRRATIVQDDVTTTTTTQQHAKVAVQNARDDPYSVSKAQEAASALLVEGKVLKSSQWSEIALRRQAMLAGATPTQAQGTRKYQLIQFIQQLEASLAFLSRIILQGGVPYIKQLEEHCGMNDNTMASDAVRNDPTTVYRKHVVPVFVQCILHDDLLGKLKRDISSDVTMNGWNIWHFLAHVGDESVELIQQALRSLSGNFYSLKKISQSMDSWGRTPSQIATLKGFPKVAMLLSSPAAAAAGSEAASTATSTASQRKLVSPTMIQTDKFSDDNNNGGWGTTSIATGGGGSLPQEYKCDIAVIEDGTKLTYEEFVKEFMAQERPVLIRNGASPAFQEIRQMLAKTRFHESFGLMPISTGSVPYQSSRQMTVHDFLEQFTKKPRPHDDAPYYMFESLPVGHPLRQVVETHFPNYAHGGTSRMEERQVQLAIGPAGSGAPPHYHKAAMNTLFYGQKRWYLFPPKDAMYTSLSAKEWLNRNNQKVSDTALECIQQVGDVMFVPDFWAHATMNMIPSVAVASEFVTPRMDFDMVL